VHRHDGGEVVLKAVWVEEYVQGAPAKLLEMLDIRLAILTFKLTRHG
jgi:hypothetical protein